MAANLFAAARKATGINQEKAAAVCNIATGTYRTHERKPSEFRLGELRALAEVYEEDATEILVNAVVGFLTGE